MREKGRAVVVRVVRESERMVVVIVEGSILEALGWMRWRDDVRRWDANLLAFE